MVPPPRDDEPIRIAADAADYDQGSEVVRLRGDVEIRRGGQTIEGQETTYDRRSGEAVATGNAFLEHPGLRLLDRTPNSTWTPTQGISRTPVSPYRSLNGRGQADRVTLLSRDLAHLDRHHLHDLSPGLRAWRSGQQARFDNTTGRGVGRDATLRVRDVPVLYTPYLNFPIDNRRQSGFLIRPSGSRTRMGSISPSPTISILPPTWMRP